MTEGAICRAEQTQPRRSGTRRWDIDQAILTLLESGPKTASRLFRELNPGMRRILVLTARGWKRWPVNVKVDYRVLKRHLGYLQRDGLIAAWSELKILHHDRGEVLWLTRYYELLSLQLISAPPPTHLGGSIQVSEIHNPFHGEDGMLKFIRWLRDPE